MSKVARPQQCQLYTGRAAFLSVAAVMTFISVCVADPSEFRGEVVPQAQGFVEESMLRVSSDVFQLALRNYAPLPEGNSSASAQMQVSQFVWRATMESCHSVPYIMLSTHLDFDRMLMLDDLAEGFLGCISAAVLIKSPNELSGLFEALDASKVLRQWVNLHVVLDLGGGVNRDGQRNPYPFNIMRNAAATWPTSVVMGIERRHRLAAAARWVQASEAGVGETAADGSIEPSDETGRSTKSTAPHGIPCLISTALGQSIPLVQPSYVLVLDVDSVLSVNAAALSMLLAHHVRRSQEGGATILRQKLKWIIQAMEVRPHARLPSRPEQPAPPSLEVEADVLASFWKASVEHTQNTTHLNPHVARLIECVSPSMPNATARALRNSTAMLTAPAHLRPAVYMPGVDVEHMKNNHTLDIFHMRDYRSAYGGLMNITRWLPRRWCDSPQRTRYTIGFEPYALLPWPIVPFDERFHGHGYSKSSWWFDRCVSGTCDLRALPEVFVLSRLSGDFNENGVLEHSVKRNRPVNADLFRSKVQVQRQRGFSCQHYGLCTFVGQGGENGTPPVQPGFNGRPPAREQHFSVGPGGLSSSGMGAGARQRPPPRPMHPIGKPRVHRPPAMAQRLKDLQDKAMRE